MPRSLKRIVVIAGEESGDLHAAAFIRPLLARHPDLHISGIGGHHMENAGVTLWNNLARFGVTGISAVIRHVAVIYRIVKDIKQQLRNNPPDLLILVDCPGLNLRLAKFAKKKLQIPVLYYISPQIWAWKAGRIKTIRNTVDKMAVIFPFEKEIYEKAGVPVAFVGHPLVDKMAPDETAAALRKRLQLPQDKRIIAMLPGSRTNEIEYHMPVLQKTADLLHQTFDDLHFVIPVAGTMESDTLRAYLKASSFSYTLIKGHAIEVMSCSDCVIVASGTASLECALLEKPMCIIYKTSWITFLIALQWIKVPYLGLCNLLQNKMTVPELLQYDCNPIELSHAIAELLTDNDVAKRMQQRLHELKLSLSKESADNNLPQLIEEMLDI